MKSIQEATEELANSWETLERARESHFSMLDDSDDENRNVKEAEVLRARLVPEVERIQRTRGPVARVIQRIPRLPGNTAVTRRKNLMTRTVNLSKNFTNTSELRVKGAQNSTIIKYAFNVPEEDGSISSPKSKRPSFMWELCFKQLQLSSVDSGNMWGKLGFDEKDFQKWWRQKASAPVSASHAWSDIKRLARRVVIQILERVQSQTFEKFRHIRHLKMLAEICREIVLYQIILCHSTLLEDVQDLQDIFEHTAPVIYLVCDVVLNSSGLSASDIPEVNSVKEKLQILDPHLRELRNRCYLLGSRIGFDMEEYREDFNKGRIFDPDEDIHDEPGFIRLNPLIAGKSQVECVKRISSIGQKQALVNDASRFQDLCSSLMEEKYDTLDKKALESIGLKQFSDIKVESEIRLGSGGYAEVYLMERENESRPVAVKKYKPNARTANRIEREARVWVNIKHKHIAPLLGFVCLTSGWATQPCLVSEPYHCDLKRLVHKFRGRCEVDGRVLTEERKIAFLRDVILALEFLHASGVAHGDLRAANVLVTNELFEDTSCYAVLNDFGMAEYYVDDIDALLDHRDLSSVNQCTSDLWLSPELLEAAPREGSLSRVSKEGDIYAFGVVFLEVVYERDPYASSKYSVRYAKTLGELPASKEELDLLSESHWTLMQGCWESLEKRLNINKVAWAVLDIHDQLIPPTPTNSDESGMAYWSRYMKKPEA